MRTRSGEGWGQLPRKMARELARVNLGSNESRLLWAIVYKTIAFNKYEDRIPGKQLMDLTGIEKRNMYRAINSLLKKGVIFKRGSVYGIQSDYSKWEKVSLKTLYKKRCQYEDKKVSVEDKKVVSSDTLIRTSKRTYQEKGVSPELRKRKEEEVPNGLKDILKKFGRSPEKKKEEYHLSVRSKKKEDDILKLLRVRSYSIPGQETARVSVK